MLNTSNMVSAILYVARSHRSADRTMALRIMARDPFQRASSRFHTLESIARTIARVA